MIQNIPIMNWLWGHFDGFFEFLARIPVPDPEMFYTFGRQLRALAIWTIILWFAVAGSTWMFAGDILNFLIKPVEGQLSPFPGGPPVFIEPTGAFIVTISLAARVGLLVAIPFFIAGFFKITPGMPTPPRKFFLFYLPLVMGLQVAGMAFVYFVMLPRGVGFLLGFGDEFAVPLITINSYFGLVKELFLYVPLAFQMPVIMWLLARARVLKYTHVMKYRWIRKVIPLGLAIFSAFITPTVDPYNFLIMWIPMLLLFEVGMFLMWIQDPEEGNYMFIRSIGHRTGRILSPFRWVYRKIAKVLGFINRAVPWF